MGDTELQLGCIQAYNDFLVDFGAEQPGRYVAGRRPAVLGPRPDPRRDRAVRRPRPQGHRVHPGPELLRPARAHRPLLGPDVAPRPQEKGLPVNFHIASGDLDPFNVGHPDNGAHANYAAMGVLVLHGQRQDDRPADHRRDLPPVPRAQLRVRRERHRMDPLRPRGPRLAVAELRSRQGAPRVRPAAQRVLPPADLRLLLVRARDRRSSAIEQLGADNVLYETDYPHPTSMSPGPASIAERPDDYLRAAFSDIDEARCARSSTTTPRASTTSTDPDQPCDMALVPTDPVPPSGGPHRTPRRHPRHRLLLDGRGGHRHPPARRLRRRGHPHRGPQSTRHAPATAAVQGRCGAVLRRGGSRTPTRTRAGCSTTTTATSSASHSTCAPSADASCASS